MSMQQDINDADDGSQHAFLALITSIAVADDRTEGLWRAFCAGVAHHRWKTADDKRDAFAAGVVAGKGAEEKRQEAASIGLAGF